jgi:hypothetical protein
VPYKLRDAALTRPQVASRQFDVNAGYGRMEDTTSRTLSMVRVCLAAAAAFLFGHYLLRSISVSPAVIFYAWPFAVGVLTGFVVGPRWQRPMRASLLLAGALVLAYIIPYTIDTIGMANSSDETIIRMVRQSGHPEHYAGIPPSELRADAVKGRILSFSLAPVLFGGPTLVGALLGRWLGRRRPGLPPTETVAPATPRT